MDYCEILDITDSLNILYVEDNISIAQETSELLKEFFNEVTVCFDGEDALFSYKQFYKENDKYYDILLTDINMPVLNGLDLSRKILEISKSQVIVIVTALNDPDYENEIQKLGINYVITKPTKIKEMISLLCQAASSSK